MSGSNVDELLPRLARYLDYFHLLTEVGKTLTSSLHREELIERLLQSLGQLLKPQDWSLLLVDRETNELYFDFVVGDAAEQIKEIRLPMGEGIAGWVAKHRKAVVVPDVNRDPRFTRKVDEASLLKTKSIVCAPLISRNEVLGVIELIRTESDPIPYDDSDLEILAPFADFVAIALENVRAFQRVEDLTLVDEWTGLYNARYLRNALPAEVARAARYDHAMSVVFIDLDNFKAVNDTHGHRVGSALLRAVGQMIQGTIREPDRSARYGGDEFIVLAPHIGPEPALAMAQRLCRALAEHEYEIEGVSGLKVTASIGVATFPGDAGSWESLLEAADRAMYLSKARGRNQVVAAKDMKPEPKVES